MAWPEARGEGESGARVRAGPARRAVRVCTGAYTRSKEREREREREREMLAGRGDVFVSW